MHFTYDENAPRLNIFEIISILICKIKFFKKLDDPYFWIEFPCLKAAEPLKEDSLFKHQVPRTFSYSFDQLPQDERLTQKWNYLVNVNLEPLA